MTDPPSKSGVAGVANVAAAEVQAMVERGERVLIIDARRPGAWDKGRLSKAVKLNWRDRKVAGGWTFDKKDLGGDKTVRLVIYGQNESDGFAALAAEKALAEGFANVMWMRGGFNEWIAARLPTESAS